MPHASRVWLVWGFTNVIEGPSKMKPAMDSKKTYPRLTWVLLLTLVTGCRIGPKYHPPAIQPPPPAFKEAPPATAQDNNPDNGNWTVAQPADAKIRGDWWAIFNEPELDDLEAQLNINNQNIKVSFENFMQARSLVRVARAQYFPTISAGPSFSRSRSSGNLSNTANANTGRTGQIYALPLEVSWTPDLFGRA